MENTLTAQMPRETNLHEAKQRLISNMGLQSYLNSYKEHLNAQWLTKAEIQQEYSKVCNETIAEMQSNYIYN